MKPGFSKSFARGTDAEAVIDYAIERAMDTSWRTLRNHGATDEEIETELLILAREHEAQRSKLVDDLRAWRKQCDDEVRRAEVH